MREGSFEIELIPYYAWANRGLSYGCMDSFNAINSFVGKI